MEESFHRPASAAMYQAVSALDLDAGWKLHPQVAPSPRRTRALLRFRPRKLSFLKNTTVVAVVEAFTRPS